MKTLNQFLDESMGGGVPLTPQELEIQKKMSRLNVRLARKRNQEMQKAKTKDTEVAPEQVKEGVSKTPEDIRAADKKWLERRGRKIAQNIKDKKPVKPMQDYGEVKEGKDKAFDYVVKQLQKKHGKDAIVTKDNPMKPPTAAQKKAYAAHKAKLAKQDHRDPTEKASDGRYSDRYSNRGSD